VRYTAHLQGGGHEACFDLGGGAHPVYSADSYVGTMKMTTGRGGQPMTMTMKYAGKRLGDCTK
jgi:hypothetical protein